MKKVLFVLKSIMTHNQQNALCIEYVSRYLQESSVSVDYLSWELNPVLNHDQNIYTIIEAEKSKGIKNFVRIASKAIHTPIGYNLVVKKLYKEIVTLYQKNSYDAIVAVINPAESAEALYLAKKECPCINCILYEIDPNSNRYKTCRTIAEKIWRLRSIQWEKKIYTSFDHVIHMSSHKKHYSSAVFSDFKEKTIYLDIPSFDPDIRDIKEFVFHSPIRFLYCGALYPRLREPYYMLQLANEVCRRIQLKLDIYTGKSMRNQLEDMAKKYNFINIHDEIPQKELFNCIEETDVLISIGNKDSDFLPSKTLMYMTTGKPIIHFFSDENDVSIEYYKSYPAIYYVDQRKPIDSEEIIKLASFLDRVKNGVEIDFDELKKELVLNTPAYTANRIVELL